MYPEFIAIYIGLAVLILLAAVIIVLQIKILKGADTPLPRSFSGDGKSSAQGGQPDTRGAAGVVFCRNCATRFDAAKRACPKCGMPR